MSTRVTLKLAVLNASRIRKNDPGCRGETLSVSELTLVTKWGAASTSRTGSLHNLGTRTPATRPGPIAWTDGQHDCESVSRGRPVPSAHRQPGAPPADVYPPTAFLRLGGQQPHDEPSHLGRHPSPGRGIEVSSHPCR